MEKNFAKEPSPQKNASQNQDSSSKFKDDIIKCTEALKSGGTILFPSETGWGVGCDATSEQAVKKLFELIPGNDSNLLTILIEHPDRLGRYVKQIPEIAIQLLEVNDKPMIIVYPGIVNLASNAVNPNGSAGIRITDDNFCKKMIAAFNKPIFFSLIDTTIRNFKEIPDNVKAKVDYTVKWRQNDSAHPLNASVIKVGLKGEVEILRH